MGWPIMPQVYRGTWPRRMEMGCILNTDALIKVLMRSKRLELAFSNLASRRAGERVQERIKVKGGLHPGEAFYVIRRLNDWGIMTVLYTYLRYIDFAVRRGWTPVVDMENIHSLYSNEGGACNAWDRFFEQPCGYGLDDIAGAETTIISSHNIVLANGYNSHHEDVTNPVKLAYWRSRAREYIRFSPECQRFIDVMRGSVFAEVKPDEVLGVYCRGTDYLNLKPKNHNVQPDPDMVIAQTEKALSETGLRCAYLVTEDADICDRFTEHFGHGGGLLAPPVKRYRSDGRFIWQQDEMLQRDRVLNGYEYLASMVLLSECGGFVGGVTGGTAAMMLLRDEDFPYQHFFDLGRY